MSTRLAYPHVPCMPYSAIRAEIHSGDLLLCSGSSPMSRMIQAATDSLWSHVGFVLRLDTINRVMVLESVESIGVRAVPLSHYTEDYNGSGAGYPGRVYLARHTAFTQEAIQLTAFSQGAIDLLGRPYDRQEILGIVARIVAAKLGLAPTAVTQGRTFICSEYCLVCYAALGYRIAYDPRGFIAPKDWAQCPDVAFLWELACVTAHSMDTPATMAEA